MLLAQAKSMNLCHEMLPNAKIGPAPNIALVYPATCKPEDVLAGLNRITFMNAAPDLGSNYYYGFDAIILEPIRPVAGTFLILR